MISQRFSFTWNSIVLTIFLTSLSISNLIEKGVFIEWCCANSSKKNIWNKGAFFDIGEIIIGSNLLQVFNLKSFRQYFQQLVAFFSNLRKFILQNGKGYIQKSQLTYKNNRNCVDCTSNIESTLKINHYGGPAFHRQNLENTYECPRDWVKIFNRIVWRRYALGADKTLSKPQACIGIATECFCKYSSFKIHASEL